MLKIVLVPDPVLSAPTKKVEVIDEKIKSLVVEMEKTLVAQTDPIGVGLAANQVGVNLSLFIIKKSSQSPTKVFINPKIIESVQGKYKLKKPHTKKSHSPVKLEGCLSIPRIWGPVTRASKIYLEYQNIDGKSIKKWFYGFEATIIQHEVDHLKGFVFTQRTLEQKGELFKESHGKLKAIEI